MFSAGDIVEVIKDGVRSRHFGEVTYSDKERSVVHLLNGELVSFLNAELASYYTNSEAVKCECGALITGSSRHSSWCPLYEKS